MARLNTRPSVASSRYTSATPMPGSSDQENNDPSTQRLTAKGKQRAMSSANSLPTPTSGSSDARGQKRKRIDGRGQRTQDEGEDDEDDKVKKWNLYFNPNQDADERRDIKRKSRALEREFNDNREELLRDNDLRLAKTVKEADRIFYDIKQTNDATLDSRLLVNVSDLAYKKTSGLVLGDTSTGVDVDEFLSKCLAYMRNGGPADRGEGALANPRRRRATREREDSDAESEDDSIGEPLDWELLGRHACFPHNSRPPVPSFLLGPLSVQKKQRTQTQRRARQTKETGREARPQALTSEELNRSDQNGLTEICKRIKDHLAKHMARAARAFADAGITTYEELQTEEAQEILKEYRVTPGGGPNLFDYVINPRSFGQTVENIFYVTFLIKEGTCGVDYDDDGMPALLIPSEQTLQEKRSSNITKHQEIFSIDYGTWQDLIEAYDIKEPLIAHREEDQPAPMGATGWYS